MYITKQFMIITEIIQQCNTLQCKHYNHTSHQLIVPCVVGNTGNTLSKTTSGQSFPQIVNLQRDSGYHRSQTVPTYKQKKSKYTGCINGTWINLSRPLHCQPVAQNQNSMYINGKWIKSVQSCALLKSGYHTEKLDISQRSKLTVCI